MPADINSLAPVTLTTPTGAKVLATESLGFSADIIKNVHHHSGNMSPTMVAVPGANPRAQLSVPFLDAYNAFGLGCVKITALGLYLSKFTDFLRDPGANHHRLKLNTNAYAAGQITGWSVNVDGILMASVDIIPLSADSNHPLVFEGGQSLPAYTGSPILHTLGPVDINGTVIPGLTGHSGALNGAMNVQRSDGFKYPRLAGRMTISPNLNLAHADPAAVLTALGLLGTDITASVVAYFKEYDPTTGVVREDGGAISLSIAKGRCSPSGFEASQGAVATTGIAVDGISTDGVTNPFAIATSVTPPTVP
jgi:hypothetical protein